MPQVCFKDYYRVLQVHYEASKDIITAAYKKLCHVYHPDRGIPNSGRMQLINEAYEILGNDTKRAQYHKIWLAHSFPSVTNEVSEPQTEFRYAFSDDSADAYAVMDDFFLALQQENNIEAYLRLTYQDKSQISSEQFIEWRKAVNACFSLKTYSITPEKTLENCIVDGVKYKKAQSFKINTTELNLHTLETNNDTVIKYAVFDGACWKVCLLISDLSASTLKFRLLSEKTGNFDPLLLYHEAVTRLDINTGLLSKTAVLEALELEISRVKRYHNPLSAVAFKVIPKFPVRLPYSEAHFADILKKELRNTDICSRIDESIFLCILIQTRILGAEKVIKKIENIVNNDETADYTITSCSSVYLSHIETNAFVEELLKKL